jgi:hypothetical protein
MIDRTPTVLKHDEVKVRAALRQLEEQELRRISRANEVGLSDPGAILGILEAVRAARGRLDDSTYGLCTVCANPIESLRIEALPYAERCLTCQASIERTG